MAEHSESEGQILRFRPRGSTFIRPLPQTSPVEDLGKYQGSEPDDYRHRMLMNLAAAGVVIFLVLGGIWIANTMAQMRKDQDCVLSGRRSCAPIAVPASNR